MSNFQRKAATQEKARAVPTLVGATRVNEILSLPGGYLAQEKLADLLERCEVFALGQDGNGNCRWSEVQVAEAKDAILAAAEEQAATKASGIDVDAIAKAVLAQLSGFDHYVTRSVERYLSTALDDTDERLSKLQEGVQGLFRQQGEVGQRSRDIHQVVNETLSGVRSDNAALKKDVRTALDKISNDVNAGLELVAQELQAVRLSLNEVLKRIPSK